MKARILELTLWLLIAMGAPLLLAQSVLLFAGNRNRDVNPDLATAGELSAEARRLIKEAYQGIKPKRLTDYHVHIAGVNRKQNGNYINPELLSPFSPRKFIIYQFFQDAFGLQKMKHADEVAMERLRTLIEALPIRGKFHLLGFDQYYNARGRPVPENTYFVVSNSYVYRQAQKYPEYLQAAVSIHPHRPDAEVALEHWARRGVRIVKWLPNSMGIDPAAPRLDRFYRLMRKYKMTLLTHGGAALALHPDQKDLGNPLRLRRALNHGVRVMVAHAAGLGDSQDLDHPRRPMLPSFQLFMRLMDTPRYGGLLYGEISAMAQSNRPLSPLITLLKRRDLHSRLRNGSDYPLPVINIMIRLDRLVDAGLIQANQASPLREIYRLNPLLFDFVLKRTYRAPGTDKGFSPRIFERDPQIGL